ncbi:MAG: hypothetical protein QM739_07675 [Propionivibrio sp.]
MKKRKLPVSYAAGNERRAMFAPGAFGRPYLSDEVQNGFTRGFIAAGLVAAVAPSCAGARESLRLALQGGTALAAGIAGANALDRRDYMGVLRAVAAGAAGLTAINYALPKSAKAATLQSDKEDDTHEEEKA